MYLTLLKALKEKLHTDAQQQHRVPGLSTSPWLVPKDCLVLRKFCFQCITSWFQTLSEMHVKAINADDNWSGLPGKTTRLHHTQTTYPNAQISPWTFTKANHFDWTRHPFHLLPRSSAELPHNFSQCKLPKHQTQLTFQWRFRSPVPPAQGCWWFRPAPGIEAWRRSSGMRLGIRTGLVRPGREATPQPGQPYGQPWWGSSEFVILGETPPCSKNSGREEKPLFSWPALRVMIPSKAELLSRVVWPRGTVGCCLLSSSHYLPVRDGETEGRGKAVH